MTDRAPYQRIADEIAAEIRSGRLAVGQRVPSTRQIVRDRGVAMATASKALAALRTAGLVVSVPGSGTVVRAATAPPDAHDNTAPRPDLTLEAVVAAGTRIADADGLALVTMRRVAARLGVSTMALYRHVPSRDDLLLRMADGAFAGIRLPEIPVAHWRRRLDAAAHLFWTVFGRHPWAAEVFSLSRPQAMPHVMPIAEWSLGTLHAMGFDANEVLGAHITLFGHVRTMALARLAEDRATADSGVSADEWMDRQGGVTTWTDRHDTQGLAFVVREGVDVDLDTVFEFGLQRLLDGFDARRRALGR